ncbi:MAG3240 family lipoprotein [Mycoplasma sp. 2575]
MKIRKKLLNLLLISPIVAIPFAVLSCSQNIKKEVYLDIDKVSRVFLNRLTLSQIASIEKDEHIFYWFDKNGRHNFDAVKIENKKMYLLNKNEWVEYKPDFPYRNNWKQFTTGNNNIRIFDSDEKSDINSFLNEYSFDDVDSAGSFNDEWFTTLSLIFGKDFNRNRDPYFEDIQTVIFRLNQDIDLNYSIMNRKYLINAKKHRVLFSNWIQPQYIQAKSFLSNEHNEMRSTFVKLLKLYLNKFNVDVASIDIDWSNSEIKHSYSGATDYISFEISSIKDWNGQELIKSKNKNKKYYLNGFRNYATNGKFGVGTKGIKEEYPLFTDYVENPLLFMDGKRYLTIIDNINHFIKSSGSKDYWNAKGLMNLFWNLKDEIFVIKIPEYRKKEDLEYKIVDFEFTDYFDTNQVFRAIVEVTKKDGTKKKYSWLSSNFDDHGHRLKGLITKNKNNANILPEDIYSFKPSNNGIKAGIKLSDFVNSNKDSAFMEGLNEASNKMDKLFNYWNNDSRQNFDVSLLDNNSYQVKVLEAYINNYLLAYALENKQGKTLDGIKRIELNLKPEKNKLGQLYIELNFISFNNPSDFKYKSKNDKVIAKASVYWNYFKGYDVQKSNDIFTLINFERLV